MTSILARPPAADRQFERIYRKHSADVYRYAMAVLRNQADAEDVTQTAFMNAYRAMQDGERPKAPRNWLIAITHNVCRQRFRQQQRRPQEMPLFEDAAEMAVEEPDDAYSAEDIQRALGYLAFNQRSALVMRELEGRSYAEIAETMDMSVSAVETLIFRARRALREQLEGALTCEGAELLLSKQADGALSRQERGQLRAHLRECEECSSVARSQRASRGALKALFGGIPVPASVGSLFGGGAPVGVAVATKAAAVVVAGAVVGGGGYVATQHATHHHEGSSATPNVVRAVKATPPAKAQVTEAHAKVNAKIHAARQAAQGRGWFIPPGQKHLKVVSHAKIAHGWTVPPGQTHLRVVSHVHLLPARAKAKKPGHPAHPTRPDNRVIPLRPSQSRAPK